MMYKLLLATALMGYLLPGTLANCEPDCTGKDPHDKVEDPKDCHKYYICMTGERPSDHSVACGLINNVFDPILEQCVPGSCNPSCVPPDCHMTCTDNIDLISDPFDCSTYKVCLAGGVVGESYRCPDDQRYFNGKYCTANEDNCCSELCTPYCYHDMIQAPDPEDCYSYYICEGEGKPDKNKHFTCDDNEVFDITVGRCVAGAQCRPLCDGGTGNVTPVPPGNKCKDSYTCPYVGLFPQCNTCQPGYFECNGAGSQGILKTCKSGYVFNINPDFPICVTPSHCPYNP